MKVAAPPADPYDSLAPYYREYAKRRSSYLDAIDAVILEHAPKTAAALLDVGAGDGVRGMSLARRMDARHIVLSDFSAEMAALCRAAGADEVWQCAAQDLPGAGPRFDVVLCLWNVLGHLPDRSARISALQRMSAMLAPGGRIFLDVNNRHNAASYGRLRVMGRRLLDALLPDERRGDAGFDWHIAGKIFPTKGHLFTPAEMAALVSSSGLKLARCVAVDYETGKISNSLFEGQILFILEAGRIAA
jgi:SAM-dependent methyltransferase